MKMEFKIFFQDKTYAILLPSGYIIFLIFIQSPMNLLSKF